MNFCFNCGGKLIEAAKFCSECGTPLTSIHTNENKIEEHSLETYAPESTSASNPDIPIKVIQVLDYTTNEAVEGVIRYDGEWVMEAKYKEILFYGDSDWYCTNKNGSDEVFTFVDGKFTPAEKKSSALWLELVGWPNDVGDEIWPEREITEHIFLARYEPTSKCGIYDIQSRSWLLEPRFEKLEKSGFSNDLLLAKEDFYVGVININGRWHIEPKFDEIISSLTGKEHFKYVKLNGKDGILNCRDNTWLVKPMFDELEEYIDPQSNVYFIATVNGLKGLLNLQEQWVLEPEFNTLQRTYLDYEEITDKARSNHLIVSKFVKQGIIRKKEVQKYGIINTQGDWLVDLAYDYIGVFDSLDDHMFDYDFEDRLLIMEQGSWGVIKPRADDSYEEWFSPIDTGDNSLRLFYDNVIIGNEYDDGSPTEYQIMNNHFEVVTDMTFSDIFINDSFIDTPLVVAVVYESGEIGVMNTECEWILPPRELEALDPTAFRRFGRNFWYNPSKTNPTLDDLRVPAKDYYGVETTGVIDMQGNWLIPPIYDDIELDQFNHYGDYAKAPVQVLRVEKNGKFGFMDLFGEWIIQPKFPIYSEDYF